MEAFDNRPRGSVGSSMIRARWLMNYWKEAEEYHIGKLYDVMIFQKVYWESMLDNAEYKGIKILDLCDPDWLDKRPVMKYVNWADATVTSTDALRDYIKKFAPDKKVITIPDRVDLKEFEYRPKRHEGRLKSLVWFGYSHNFHYVGRTLDVLYDNNIELTAISDHAVSLTGGMPDVKIKFIKYNQDTLQKEILRHDAVLLPETADYDLRGRFKSNNKTIQMWALGMPVIKTPSDLRRLQNADERIKEIKEKRAEVEQKYDVKLSVKEYKKLINELAENK